jgi:hypothetical protein
VNDTAIIDQLIHQLSVLIYRAVVAVQQQQQTELLIEQYQSLDWGNLQYRAELIRAASVELVKGVQRSPSPYGLMRRFEQVLKAIFVARFFKLNAFKTLVKQAEQIVLSQPMQLERALEPQPNGRYITAANAIAILLLDAENLKLSAAEEKFLQDRCNYFIQIKIAFANWRTMGKHDLDLQARGYQMIHVPTSKNSADMKMTAIGSSIFVHYPNAKAVLVCSSDQDFTHLNTTLQTHGLKVYSVRKQGEVLVIHHAADDEKAELHTPKVVQKIPSIAQVLIWVQKIIQEEQDATGNPWIKLSRLSVIFSADYGMALSSIMKVQAGKRARDIFLDHPQIFGVHQSPGRSEIYVCLLVPASEEQAELASAQGSAQKTLPPFEPARFKCTIASTTELEEILVGILKELAVQSGNKPISITELQTRFQIQQGQPLNQVFEYLNIRLRYITFLESCSAFKLEKMEKGWLVSLADPSAMDTDSTAVDPAFRPSPSSD